MKKIGVLGAGTWGMALARMLSNTGHDVMVWSALEQEIDEFRKQINNMDNSLLIGKYIYKLLSEDVVLSAKVTSKKIFPLVANADTTYPFIVYARTGLTVEYCKDGTVENRIEF